MAYYCNFEKKMIYYNRKQKRKGEYEYLKINSHTKKQMNIRKNNGITLVALVITTIFSYDENVKSSNNKGFLLQTI